MKTKNLIMLLAGVFAIGCAPEKEEEHLNEYFVAGYDDCSGVNFDDVYGEAGGYFLVSVDLKDTLVTYNFPNGVFRFLKEVFPQFERANTIAFDKEVRDTLKFRIEYEIVPEGEKYYALCTAQDPPGVFGGRGIQEVRILSATKID